MSSGGQRAGSCFPERCDCSKMQTMCASRASGSHEPPLCLTVAISRAPSGNRPRSLTWTRRGHTGHKLSRQETDMSCFALSTKYCLSSLKISLFVIFQNDTWRHLHLNVCLKNCRNSVCGIFNSSFGSTLLSLFHHL